METSRASYTRLATSVAAGNVPQRLRVKAPEVQFTADFGKSGLDAVTTAKTALNDAQSTFQTAILTATVNAKAAEVKFWEDKCDLHVALEAMSDIAANVYNDRCISFKIPTIEYSTSGQAKLGDWVVSPQKKADRDVMVRSGGILVAQILVIVAACHKALNKKISKKGEVAAKADVEMADATKPGPSIQSLIDKGLNARLKKLNLVPGGKKVNSYPSLPTSTNEYSTYLEYLYVKESKGSCPQSFNIESCYNTGESQKTKSGSQGR
jgi:hypothetical protein